MPDRAARLDRHGEERDRERTGAGRARKNDDAPPTRSPTALRACRAEAPVTQPLEVCHAPNRQSKIRRRFVRPRERRALSFARLVRRRHVDDDGPGRRRRRLRRRGPSMLRGERVQRRRLLHPGHLHGGRRGVHGGRDLGHLLGGLVSKRGRGLRRRRPIVLRRRRGRRRGRLSGDDLHGGGRALLGRDVRRLRERRRRVLRGRGHVLCLRPVVPVRRGWRRDVRGVRRHGPALLRRGHLQRRPRVRQLGRRNAEDVHELWRAQRRVLSGRRLPVGRQMHGRDDGGRWNVHRVRRPRRSVLRRSRGARLQHRPRLRRWRRGRGGVLPTVRRLGPGVLCGRRRGVRHGPRLRVRRRGRGRRSLSALRRQRPGVLRGRPDREPNLQRGPHVRGARRRSGRGQLPIVVGGRGVSPRA
jgi:hypothetical protein